MEQVMDKVIVNGELIFSKKYVKLYYFEEHKMFIADWVGYQTEQSIEEGCGTMIDLIKEKGALKFLNNNKNTKGTWTFSLPYVVEVVLPGFARNGIKHFAWVISDDVFSSFSANRAMQDEVTRNITTMSIAPFKDLEEGINHLKNL